MPERLVDAGFSATEAEMVTAAFDRHPETRLKVLAAADLGLADATRRSSVVESLSMFAADLLAASIPVSSFAFFTLNVARWVSLGVTLGLLVVLGIGRAAFGRRPVVPSVLETVAIAAAAAVAGVLIGRLVT